MEAMFSGTFHSHSLSDTADRSDWIAIRTCPWCVCGNTHSGGKWNSRPVENKFYFVALRFDRGRGGALRIVAPGEGLWPRDAKGWSREKRRVGSPPVRRWATRVSILRWNFLATRLNAKTSLSTFFRILFCSLLPLAKLFPIPRRCNIIFSRLGDRKNRALE